MRSPPAGAGVRSLAVPFATAIVLAFVIGAVVPRHNEGAAIVAVMVGSALVIGSAMFALVWDRSRAAKTPVPGSLGGTLVRSAPNQLAAGYSNIQVAAGRDLSLLTQPGGGSFSTEPAGVAAVGLVIPGVAPVAGGRHAALAITAAIVVAVGAVRVGPALKVLPLTPPVSGSASTVPPSESLEATSASPPAFPSIDMSTSA